MNAERPLLNKQIKNYLYNPDNQIGKGFSSVVYRGMFDVMQDIILVLRSL
jgi:hypothetical protein